MKNRPVFPLLWLVVLAPFVLFSPAIFGGRALFWGTISLQFVPWRHLAWQQLLQGSLPLWNPDLGMGAPLLANYQSALLYPPNWLFFILEALGGLAWSTWGIALLAAAHLAWAALGMARLVGTFGASPLAQAVSGAAFGLSGYLAGRVGFHSLLVAAAWMPWVVAAAIQAGCSVGMQEGWASRLWRLVRLSVLIAMQLLAGHAQTCWYTLILAGILTAWIAYSHIGSGSENRLLNPRSYRLQRVLLAGVMLLGASTLALLLSATQILPTAEYLVQSQRSSQVGYDFAMTYSFWPWRFLTLLAPGMFGSPVSGDYWGYANFWEDHIYVGLLPVILVIALILGGFFTWLRQILLRLRGQDVPTPASLKPSSTSSLPASGITSFLLAIVALSFLLALGDRTPIFPWLYRHAPSFDMFQAPTRFTIWAVFAFAWLAGIGVDRWRRPQGKALYWSRLAVAGAAAITLGSGITWVLLQDISPTFIRATAIAGMWGVAIGILNLLAPEEKARSSVTSSAGRLAPWAWCVLILLCVDLISAGWGMNPDIETTFYSRENPAASKLRDQLGDRRLYMSAESEYDLKFNRFMRFDTFDPGEEWGNLRATLLPNLNLLDGISSANNFDPLLQDRFANWIAGLENQPDPTTRERLLNLMNVGAVENISSTSGSPSFEILDGGQRLRWASCAVFVTTPEEAWDRLTGGQFDLNSEVVLEGIQDPQPECPPSKGSPRLKLVADEPGQVAITATTSVSGWLVLADTWYPGWLARVDGQPMPVLRANYLFRAVQLPAGEHRIEFFYRPLSFWLGLGISGLTWGALLFLSLKRQRS